HHNTSSQGPTEEKERGPQGLPGAFGQRLLQINMRRESLYRLSS
ncbi:hypothetical protein ACLKA7_000713, partial [Drosophila subpalustris]